MRLMTFSGPSEALFWLMKPLFSLLAGPPTPASYPGASTTARTSDYPPAAAAEWELGACGQPPGQEKEKRHMGLALEPGP
jgi:hypothetical protein